MLTCPRCSATAPDAGTLAGHLVTDHLISPSAAFLEARSAAQEPAVDSPAPKEATMSAKPHHADPASCQVCAGTRRKYGHPCKRPGGPGKSTSNGGRGPKRSAPAVPREAVSLNGANGARKAGQAFLDQLHRLRAELDEKIADVAALVEVL